MGAAVALSSIVPRRDQAQKRRHHPSSLASNQRPTGRHVAGKSRIASFRPNARSNECEYFSLTTTRPLVGYCGVAIPSANDVLYLVHDLPKHPQVVHAQIPRRFSHGGEEFGQHFIDYFPPLVG
jgi:hypothetical protein